MDEKQQKQINEAAEKYPAHRHGGRVVERSPLGSEGGSIRRGCRSYVLM